MSEIYIGMKSRAKLREQFSDVSECTLSEAIHFKRNSITARRIRSYAVNRLGAFADLT